MLLFAVLSFIWFAMFGAFFAFWRGQITVMDHQPTRETGVTRANSPDRGAGAGGPVLQHQAFFRASICRE
jgi:hypothetical protein